MAYPVHMLLQFGGPLPFGEEWVNTIRFRTSPFLETTGVGTGMVNDVAADVVTWLTDGTMRFSTKTKLEYVKLNLIKADGTYKDPSVVHAKYYTGTLPQGTATSTMLPPQLSLVASWGTGARGPRRRGRIYLPPQGSAILDEDGRLSPGMRLQMATGCKTLLANLGNWPGLDTGLSIVKPSVVSEMSGEANAITEVRVGSAIDTQRRRRSSYPEEYVSVAV